MSGRRTHRRGALSLLAALALFGGCATTEGGAGRPAAPPLDLSDIGKSELDVVAELSLRENLHDLRTLMHKLYARNPRQWRGHGEGTPAHIADRLFGPPLWFAFPVLQGKRGATCLQLAFDPHYRGDRVLAFVAGLTSMLYASYNDQSTFYMFDDLHPQSLYNSARNLEIAAWRLSNARAQDGRLYLLSNSAGGVPANLSFERLFGKLIARQDTLARLVADSTNRTIRNVVQRLASAVFLPL